MFSITIRERSGQVYTFHFDKPEVLIGRVKGNDVILPKQNISKRHAMVRVHGPRFVVEDLGSTNGTYVNGHRIASAVEIGADDKVYLGDFVMNFIDLSHAASSSGDLPVVPGAPDAPDLPDVPYDAAAEPAPGAAVGRRRDENVSGTLRAGNLMSGVSGAPQARAGGVDEAVFEDQIELGDLDNLLPTTEGEFGGVGPFGAGADWEPVLDAPGDGRADAAGLAAADGGRTRTGGKGGKAQGVSPDKAQGGSRSTDAFEFEDMPESPAPFDGTNGLKTTRPGMARASDFGESTDDAAGAMLGDGGAGDSPGDAFLAPTDLPTSAPEFEAAASAGRPADDGPGLAPSRPASRSGGRAGPVVPAVAEHATRAYVSGSPPLHDDRMTGPVDGLSRALGTATAVGIEDFGLSMPPVAPLAAAAVAHGMPASPRDGTAFALQAGAAISFQAAPPPARVAAPPGALPRALGGSTPASDAAATSAADVAHFDALALLYRNALRDLRPGVPADAAQMSDTDWAEMEDRVVAFVDAASELPEDADVARLKRDLIYELAGLGPLEPMLDDPEVEAIEVNGPTQIFVFRAGRREPVAERFSCQQSLAAAVDRLVRATGMVQARATSHADGTLVDGTSVRVVWPPLCPAGPAVLLRKPRAESPGLDDLVDRGIVRSDTAVILRHLVQQRRSIAICGVPNVGRRTVVNAVAMLIESPQRIVVVEDGQRLRLDQANVVRLDSAAQSVAGPSVLQVARRLLPDWILLGEAASIDVADLFSVAADGLPPWLGSFHAQDIGDFIQRGAHALVLRHPGIAETVAAARVTRAVDAVASFGWDDAAQRFALDAVQVQDPVGSGRYRELTAADFGDLDR